jgi:6-pyruvoyltetrahydropterin/6-carboxytetrahydropterin synthase
MTSQPRYRIVLAKEDFKFACAHFTIFGDGRAELLHGHNYQVQVELSGSGLDEEGLLVDIDAFKRALRACCARLDSRTLLPADSSRLGWERAGDAIEVRFGARAYRLPAEDVVLLPVVNTSIELLAHLLWQELAPRLRGSRVDHMALAVEETAGQRCWYEDRLA